MRLHKYGWSWIKEEYEFAIDLHQWILLGINYYEIERASKTWNFFFLCFRITYFRI